MSDQNNFFLTDTSGIRKVETIQLYHPDFGNLYFQSDWIDETFIARDENGVNTYFAYQLFTVDLGNVLADLDQEVTVNFQDYDDEFKIRLFNASHMTPIQFRYRSYRDDDLNSPLDVLQTLNVLSISTDDSGVITFRANAEMLNAVKTGIRYTLVEYPLLKGTI